MAFSPPTVTGYAGGFDPTMQRAGNGAEANYNSLPRYGRTSAERRLSTVLAKSGLRGLRQVMRTLNGAAPGSAAVASYPRVVAPLDSDDLGGVRVIETYTLNTGNTTAAQQEYIEDHIMDDVFRAVPDATDLGGNGGGGKLGV